MLNRIHDGHLGITKCRERAQSTVWWPGINEDIKRRDSACQHCEERQPSQRREPLTPTQLPDRPFQKVAADICDFKGQQYLILIDYYSRYLEISHLPRITAEVVVGRMKNIFAHMAYQKQSSQITDVSLRLQSSRTLQKPGSVATQQAVRIFHSQTEKRNEQCKRPRRFSRNKIRS